MGISRRILAVLVPSAVLFAAIAAASASLLAPSGRLSLTRAVVIGVLLAAVGNVAGHLAVSLSPGAGRSIGFALGGLLVASAVAAPEFGEWSFPLWFRLYSLSLLLPGLLLSSLLCDRSRGAGRCGRRSIARAPIVETQPRVGTDA